jgi:hypothetical protein
MLSRALGFALIVDAPKNSAPRQSDDLLRGRLYWPCGVGGGGGDLGGGGGGRGGGGVGRGIRGHDFPS